MKKILFYFLLFSAFFHQNSIAVLGDIGGQLPQNDTANHILSASYRNFRNTYNDDNSVITDYENHYRLFRRSIYTNIDNTYDPNTYLTRIRRIRDFITQEKQNPDKPFLFSLVDNSILKRIDHRIDLARLDNNLNMGIHGNIVNTDVNNIVCQTLRIITGRVFQVSLIDGLIDVDDSAIQSTSSGALINYDFGLHQINNIQLNQATNLNALLTCAHAFSADDDRSAFFFVQTSNLHGDTGFPNGVNDLNGNNGMIDFLNTDNNSYRVGNIEIRNRQNNNFQQIDLILGQPQFEEREDIVIGFLNQRLNQQLPNYNINFGVQFQQNNVIANQRTYAAGYPGCDHFDESIFNNLVQDEGVSPFWLSGSDILPISNNDGTIIHHSPTAKGMSGGSIFQINQNHLNILGVITGGEDNNERGCHWR
jgi:hypothetical protein